MESVWLILVASMATGGSLICLLIPFDLLIFVTVIRYVAEEVARLEPGTNLLSDPPNCFGEIVSGPYQESLRPHPSLEDNVPETKT